MSLFHQQPLIKQECTDFLEDLPSAKKCICRLCGSTFSEEKFLGSHVHHCKNIGNPEERLGITPTTVKKEEIESTELVDEQATSELTLDIKDEEMEFTETTVTVYGDSMAAKAATLEEVIPCSKYDDTTTQTGYLKAHKQRCARNKSLEVHKRGHAGREVFKCSVCDYVCANRSTLRVHIQTHTGEKPFKCTFCDYASARKSYVIQHIRTHTGEKPFKCTLCDYASTGKKLLIQHNRTHTGETPFKCTLCDYATVCCSTLAKHKRTHTGEKPFKCILCDYASGSSSNLTRHVSTHTGEKPFKCTLCDHRYAHKYHLNRHMRKHSDRNQLA